MDSHINQNVGTNHLANKYKMEAYKAVAGRRRWWWLVCVMLEAYKMLQQLCAAVVDVTTQYLIAIPAQYTVHTLVCNVTAARLHICVQHSAYAVHVMYLPHTTVSN